MVNRGYECGTLGYRTKGKQADVSQPEQLLQRRMNTDDALDRVRRRLRAADCMEGALRVVASGDVVLMKAWIADWAHHLDAELDPPRKLDIVRAALRYAQEAAT